MKSPLQAIKEKCLECSGHCIEEIIQCPVKDCPLYEYRLTLLRKKSNIELKKDE
jgi:hypothetical protein